MNRFIKYTLLFSVSIAWSQEIYTEYLVVGIDSLDVFSYQVPGNYNNSTSHPLLVAFHQWGGDENSPYYTQFDEEANNRNWLYLSPFGGSSNNYNHQGMQAIVEGEILWIMENYNIDKNRIYIVGGSMGGATGAIYANNHLDPTKPMVAATASASGILDCERRAIEMDGNNSMIEWFGGEWYEVPFEYHRNSAVYFADSTQSMHYNLLHTPLYLDFGASEPHRTHAEDLYNLLLHYNENMWIDTDPTGSHGYSIIDEEHACDWLSQFELIDAPNIINVNLDEPSRAYWAEAMNQNDEFDFIKINSEKCYENTICIKDFFNSDTLLLHFINDSIPSNFQILNNQYGMIFTFGITGDSTLMSLISNIEMDSFNGAYWDNINLQDNIIYVDINGGQYFMSFILNEFDDINQDGIWDILDIIQLTSFILQDITPSELQFQLADLNNDDQLNIYDIILLVNNILN